MDFCPLVMSRLVHLVLGVCWSTTYIAKEVTVQVAIFCRLCFVLSAGQTFWFQLWRQVSTNHCFVKICRTDAPLLKDM